jgi:hypothetical protein
MPMLDFSETPSRGKATPRKSLKLVLGIGVISGAFALSSTLAANIALNDSGTVEFGQGIAQTTACSNGDSLIVTPLSSFTNAAGAGSFKFTAVTVSDIPESCRGVDFVISAYNTSGDALAIFNTDSTVASVWNNNGSFQAGTGTQGVEIESTTGSFTINFTTPAALATNVARVTLQSTKHADYNCADDFIGCRVGDLGPGGGTIFYVNDSGFSVPGSVCGNNCHNLEYAPSTWTWEVGYSGLSSGDQGMFLHASWGEHTGTFLRTNRVPDSVKNGTGDQAIGAGYMNTLQMRNRNPINSIAVPVRQYAGTNNSAGQWYIPSLYELKAIYDSSAFTGGSFIRDLYTSSSEETDIFYWCMDFIDGSMSRENRGGTALIRPIRAF